MFTFDNTIKNNVKINDNILSKVKYFFSIAANLISRQTLLKEQCYSDTAE